MRWRSETDCALVQKRTALLFKHGLRSCSNTDCALVQTRTACATMLAQARALGDQYARGLKFITSEYAKNKRCSAILATDEIVGTVIQFQLIHNSRAR